MSIRACIMSISSPSPFSPPHIRSRAILAALGWTIVILGVAGINWVMIESEMQKAEHAGGGASTPIIISSNILRSFSTNNILGYGAVWLVGMAGIYIASRKLNQAIVERDAVISSAQASEMRLRAISDNLMDAALYVYTLDEQNQPRFEYVSAGIEVLTGVCVEDILNDPQKLRRGILPEYRAQLDALEKKSREGLTRFELEFQHNNEITGKTRWSLMRATPYRRLDGSIYWYTVMVDITTKKRNEEAVRIAHEQLNTHMQEIEKLHEKLREQAFLDPLTGLNNRRYLSERMTGEIARADRENACLSILIADIDHFKNINDTYGHQVGDKFLVEIAGLLKNHTRGSDIV